MLVLTILSLGIILLFCSSIILWHLECKKYNNNIENRLYNKNKPSSDNNIIDTRERTIRKKVVKADADADADADAGVSKTIHIE